MTSEVKLRRKNKTYTIYDLVVEGFTLSVTHLNPYMSTVGHFHPYEEVYYFIEGGKGFMEFGRNFYPANGFVVVPPNEFHYVSNLGRNTLTFVCAWKSGEQNKTDKVGQKILAFDCDGVICETQGTDYASATPKKQNIEKINALYDNGNYILIYTGRGTQSGIDWRELTERQFGDWGLKYHELKFGKPTFDIFVDNHAWNVKDFEGGLI